MLKKKATFLGLLLSAFLLSGCSLQEQIDAYPTTMFKPGFYDNLHWIFIGSIILGTISFVICLLLRILLDQKLFKESELTKTHSIILIVSSYAIGLGVCLLGLFVKNDIWRYISLFNIWGIFFPVTVVVRLSGGTFRTSTAFWFFMLATISVSSVLGFFMFQNIPIVILFALSPIGKVACWVSDLFREEENASSGEIMGMQFIPTTLLSLWSGWICLVFYPMTVLFWILFAAHVAYIGYFFAHILTKKGMSN